MLNSEHRSTSRATPTSRCSSKVCTDSKPDVTDVPRLIKGTPPHRPGDTKLVFYHKESFGKKATICCAWLHTHFLSQQPRTVLRRLELDKACKDKHHRFPDTFEIEIHVVPHEHGQGEVAAYVTCVTYVTYVTAKVKWLLATPPPKPAAPALHVARGLAHVLPPPYPPLTRAPPPLPPQRLGLLPLALIAVCTPVEQAGEQAAGQLTQSPSCMATTRRAARRFRRTRRRRTRRR